MSVGEDGFVVTGGREFAVRLDSLETAAAALSGSSSALTRAERALYAVRRSVETGACVGSVLALQFDQESRRLEAAARRSIDECVRAARAVGQAAAAYAEEESKRAGAADGLQNLLLGVVSPQFLRLIGATGIADLFEVSSADPGTSLARVLRDARGDQIEGSPSDLLLARGERVAAGGGDPGSYSYALRSLRQAQGQAKLDDGTMVPQSSILVERFPRADGSTAVMVTVPGTQTWDEDAPDGNVFDSEGILDGMAYRDSQVRGLIEQALADQKVGEGDSVLFNCYSQGGIHVFGLLEDEAFRERYKVAAVTAVGSPVSAFDLPAEVPVLSLTNADDIVPAASGRPVGPSPGVVSVRTPSRVGDAGTAMFPQEVIAQAHDLGNYERDAQIVDGSRNAAVLSHAATVSAALGGAAAGAAASRERFVYTGADASPKPRPSP